MKILICEKIWVEVNGQERLLVVNDTLDLVQEHKAVEEEGSIVYYNVALIDDIEVDIPHLSSCVVEDYQVPEYKDGREKLLHRMDSTTDYLSAYEERLGIIVNPYCDVAYDSFMESEGSD